MHHFNRLLAAVAAVALHALAHSAWAVPLAVTNPGFESNVLANPPAAGPDNFIGAAGQGQTPTAVPGWSFAAGANPDSFTAYGGVSDLAVPNHAPEGALDNNIAWLFLRPTGVAGSMSVSQPLAGSTLQNNTFYTLTVRVAQARREEGLESNPNPVFPTLGNGVSTGDVFARLRVGNLTTAMPGFQPATSIVSGVADDQWVNWTLNWQTGPAEPLAGQPLFVQLFHQGTRPTGGLSAEVFFDDVVVNAVPEPTTAGVAALGLVGIAALRRRRLVGIV